MDILKINKQTVKKGGRITAVWQNGGFSAKINIRSMIELLCKTEHLCFDFRHFAKPQTVRLHNKGNLKIAK